MKKIKVTAPDWWWDCPKCDTPNNTGLYLASIVMCDECLEEFAVDQLIVKHKHGEMLIPFSIKVKS